MGLLATIALEFINTEILARWTYGSYMPRMPVLGTGLAPIAQWVVIPLVVLWYLRRLHPPLPDERKIGKSTIAVRHLKKNSVTLSGRTKRLTCARRCLKLY